MTVIKEFPDKKDDDDDFVLQGQSAWVRVDKNENKGKDKTSVLVHIHRTDEGVVVDMYNEEDFDNQDGLGEPVATTYAFFSEHGPDPSCKLNDGTGSRCHAISGCSAMKESRWWVGSIEPSPVVHLILNLNEFPKASCGQGELTVKWKEMPSVTLMSGHLCQKCKKIYENLKALAEGVGAIEEVVLSDA